jgi:hypothetical protein
MRCVIFAAAWADKAHLAAMKRTVHEIISKNASGGVATINEWARVITEEKREKEGKGVVICRRTRHDMNLQS